MLGRPLTLQAVQADPPNSVVVVTEETQLQLLERPLVGVAVSPVGWEDVGGLDEAKQRVRTFLELSLRYSGLLGLLGLEAPRCLLLHGPPGVGKTLLARAAAGEADANVVEIEGPEVLVAAHEPDVALRGRFEEAMRRAPAVVLLEHLEFVAPRIDMSGDMGRRLTAQVMALLDGLRGDVVVIATSNRPELVDPAVKARCREVEVPGPDLRGRYEILQIRTRHMRLAPDVDLRRLAQATEGLTGADLNVMVGIAAVNAVRRAMQRGLLTPGQLQQPEAVEKVEVEMADFLEAMRFVKPTAQRAQ